MKTYEVFDLNEARLAHLRWEVSLEELVAGTIKTLDGHEGCPLGKWLCGDAEFLYGNDSTYNVLKVAHKQFHRLVAGFIENNEAGNGIKNEDYISKIKLVSQQVLFLLTCIELGNIEQRAHQILTFSGGLTLNNSQQYDQNIKELSVSPGIARLTHLKWLRDLQVVINNKRSHSKNKLSIKCSLGQWIRNMRADRSTLLVLDDLDKAHIKFHNSVDDTLAALSNNDYQAADNKYSLAYDYSSEVIKHLTMIELIKVGTPT